MPFEDIAIGDLVLVQHSRIAQNDTYSQHRIISVSAKYFSIDDRLNTVFVRSNGYVKGQTPKGLRTDSYFGRRAIENTQENVARANLANSQAEWENFPRSVRQFADWDMANQEERDAVRELMKNIKERK